MMSFNRMKQIRFIDIFSFLFSIGIAIEKYLYYIVVIPIQDIKCKYSIRDYVYKYDELNCLNLTHRHSLHPCHHHSLRPP